MIEFMDEDELLAEFHRAGIWLPEEKEAAQKRANSAAQRLGERFIGEFTRQQTNQQQNLAGTALSFQAARMKDLSALQRVPSDFERQLHDPRQLQASTSVLGGLLGGLF